MIGASTGYGLASRIAAAFGSGAALGVFFEKAGSETKTATAGWVPSSAAFDKAAKEAGLYIKLCGDAFSHECRAKVIELIKQDLGQIDLVVYSWPRRCAGCRTPAKWCAPPSSPSVRSTPPPPSIPTRIRSSPPPSSRRTRKRSRAPSPSWAVRTGSCGWRPARCGRAG